LAPRRRDPELRRHGAVHRWRTGGDKYQDHHPGPYNGYWRVGDESTGGWSAHGNNFFTGTIDEAAVYPTALTAARIAAHHEAAQ
jgi:hypothetical protein